MTNWEKIVEMFLRDIWTSKTDCICMGLYGACGDHRSHPQHQFKLPCPPPTRELGFKLLEVLIPMLITVCIHEGSYEDYDPAMCRLKRPFTDNWIVGQAPELLDAIINAAAQLVDIENEALQIKD